MLGLCAQLLQATCIAALSMNCIYPCRYGLSMMLQNRTWDKNLLIAAVGTQLPALHQSQSVHDIDCRSFLPPPLQYLEGMHTGCHPALFERVVRMENFRDLLAKLRVNIDNDNAGKRSNIAVLLCDKLGRHGSMAVGKALAECIVADPDCTLGSVNILADQHSESYCGVCARCEFWTRRWTSRNAAVRMVKQMWFDPL
jgi:hypothetical protein